MVTRVFSCHSRDPYAHESRQQGQQKTHGRPRRCGTYRPGENSLKNRQRHNENHQRQQKRKKHFGGDRRAFDIPQVLVHLLAIVPLIACMTKIFLGHTVNYYI
jgi:hypothetical protein